MNAVREMRRASTETLAEAEAAQRETAGEAIEAAVAAARNTGMNAPSLEDEAKIQADAITELLFFETAALDIAYDRRIMVPYGSCALRQVMAVPRISELIYDQLTDYESTRVPLNGNVWLVDLLLLEAEYVARGYVPDCGSAVGAYFEEP